MKIMTVLLAMLLTGCACFKEPEPQIVRVEVPVTQKCVKELPARPAFVTDAEMKAMSDYQLVLAMRRDQMMRRGYTAELEALVEACR